MSHFWRLEVQHLCWQGCFLLRVIREGSVLGLTLWLVDGHLLSMHVCVQVPHFYKNINHNWIRTHPYDLILT